TTLASFNGTNGNQPTGRVFLDSNGNLFGTTSSGGMYNCGTVFELQQGSSTITVLANFNDVNGIGPGDVVVDSSGNVFGTAGGGAFGDGIVYEVKKGSGVITTLGTFNGDNGADPSPSLMEDSSGNLFGTT